MSSLAIEPKTEFRRSTARPRSWPLRRLSRFARETGGASAIEFALVMPLLLACYLMTMEIFNAIETDKRLSRASSMVADLVGQQNGIALSTLEDIMRLAAASLQPYGRSTPVITVSGIQLDRNGNPTVVWARRLENGRFSNAASTVSPAVPQRLRSPESFFVQSTATLHYRPVIAWKEGTESTLGLIDRWASGITMSETYFTRPRLKDQLACSGC